MHQPRYHYLDALRAFAMLLGVVFHSLLAFVEIPLWPAQDIYRCDSGFSPLQHAIHGFRMPLFFLVSGYFTALLWRRRGTAGMLRQRARRIGLPLLVGTLVMWPLLFALGSWGAAKKARTDPTGHGPPVAMPPADLWEAARAGDPDGTRALLVDGHDPDGLDRFGISPLCWAALHGHPDIVTTLLDGGARIDRRDARGNTALHAAALLSRTGVARRLIERGAGINPINHRGETPLDRSRKPRALVVAIAGLIQMEVDMEKVVADRESLSVLLERSGARQRSELSPEEIRQNGGSGWGPLLRIYTLGALFPAFHHLWFLYFLCWLILLSLVANWLWRRIPVRLPARLLDTPLSLIYLVPLTFLPQLTFWQSFGADTAPGVLPWPPMLFYYAIFFGFGAVCFGRDSFEQRAGHHWIAWSLAALAILIIGLRAYHAGHHVLASASAAGYAWAMIFACLGVFRRAFSAENRVVRFLSDSAYWVYLAHLPLVIGLQIVVCDWQLPAVLKLALVFTTSSTILLLSYRYAVRYTPIGKALNGPRHHPGTCVRSAR